MQVFRHTSPSTVRCNPYIRQGTSSVIVPRRSLARERQSIDRSIEIPKSKKTSILSEAHHRGRARPRGRAVYGILLFKKVLTLVYLASEWNLIALGRHPSSFQFFDDQLPPLFLFLFLFRNQWSSGLRWKLPANHDTPKAELRSSCRFGLGRPRASP